MDQRSVRAERSKAALKAAFLELFRTKEPEEISVVELCRMAGVNRSTFYAHYEYMDKLIREVLWENVAEVCEGFGMQWGLPSEDGGAGEVCESGGVQWGLPLEDGGVARSLIDSYLRRFLSNPTLLRFCTCSNSGSYRSLIIRAQVELSLGSAPDPVRYYTAYYHNAGVFNCVLEWLNNDKPIPSDTVTEIIHEFSKVMYRSQGAGISSPVDPKA